MKTIRKKAGTKKKPTSWAETHRRLGVLINGRKKKKSGTRRK